MIAVTEGGFPEPDFGCSLVDAGCHMTEGLAKIIVGAIVGMGDFAADIIVSAFDQEITDSEWGVAFGQWGQWAALMATVVAIVMLYQMGIGLILQNRKRIGQAALGGLFSIPIAAIAVMIMARMVAIVDDGAQKMIETIQGGQIGKAMVATLGMSDGEWTGDSAIHDAVTTALTAGSVAAMIPAVINVLLLAIAGMLLTMAMGLREYGLLILAALAPLALMLVGQGKLAAWSEKWFSLVAGLMLMKPIVAGIIALSINISAEATGRTFAELLIAILVLFFAAFAPFWVTKMVDFTGAEIGSAMAHRPSMRGGSSRVSAVMNNKVVKSLMRALGRRR
jgi:hypothetical protein